MSGFRQRDTQEEQAEVSMSPLIDCVFLLLIFFLVSTIMKKQNRDIDVSLPESASAVDILPTDDQIVVGIDKDANVYYEGEESTIMALHTALREQSIDDPEVRIRLDTDAETPIHRIIEVMDLCQFNHLQNVWIRTYDTHYNKK